MIVRPKPQPWELFTIFRLSIIPKIAPQIFCVFAFSLFVVWLEKRFPAHFAGWGVAPFTLLGIALSIFLGFRNNACYDRWWEARRQLGALIGEMRSFARAATSLPGEDRSRRIRMVRTAIAYTYVLMSHLRGIDCRATHLAELRNYLEDPETPLLAKNPPDALLRIIAADCAAMMREGEIDQQIWRTFDERLTAITAIQVACERIRSTPTPYVYTLLLHRTAYAFCFLLPFSLVSTLSWATPVFCSVVAYAFFGLDSLGDELEEPFGASLNALPLKSMARTVEINLLEAMGEAKLPEPLLPLDFVLD